jgi:hypothetical protein
MPVPPASIAKVAGLLNFAADALTFFIDLPSCRDEEHDGRHVNWASRREARTLGTVHALVTILPFLPLSTVNSSPSDTHSVLA